MKNNLQHYLLVILLLYALKGHSQDIHFSQISETPLLRNPALAGLFTGDVRIQAVYRSQWNAVTTAYRTGSLNGEVKLHVGNGDDFLTVGAQVLYDKAGTVSLSTTQVLPALNYHKSLSAEKNSYLSLGVMGGWVQRSIDRSKMTTNSQFDGTSYNGALADGENFNKTSYSYLDGSVGMSYNGQLGDNIDNNMYIGLAYHHLNKPKKLTFYTADKSEMQAKWVASAGIRMSVTDNSFFTIEGDYTKQGVYSQTLGGAMYSVKLGEGEVQKYSIHAGAYLRWKDAIIPVVKLESKPIIIAVSYDANISQLKTVSTGRGGFEVSLNFQKFRNINAIDDAMRCPRF